MIDLTLKFLLSKVDDDGKLKRKWSNKILNARKEGIECKLSFREYCYLVYSAGLVSSDLGFKGNKYVLARYNDRGDYILGNCRFITQKENSDEKFYTDDYIKNNLKHMEDMRYLASLKIKELGSKFNERVSDGIRNSLKYQRRKLIFCLKNYIKEQNKDKRYSGVHNSHYGTFWITNGKTNLVWKDNKGLIPEGYYRGRVCK